MTIEQFIPEEETMNEKHTPGPWKYSHRGVYFYSNVHKYGETIAKCYGNNYQANARLIAAAPELLEACKIALQAINECDMEVGLFNATEQEITDKLYAAIAQAKSA